MTRRLKRSKEFELSLDIRDDSFVRPPRDSQRNWILNRVIREAADELQHLHSIAGSFVPGAPVDLAERSQTDLQDDDIMEDWQIPIMKEMARISVKAGGDVLEVGFGRGVASTFIQDLNPGSHTIVECNDSVVRRFESWKEQYPESDIRLLHGMWQDRVDAFQTYDTILFHTYPLNENEYVEQVSQSVTFAEHFFAVAAKHLRPGGVFTYLTSEIDTISRAHQRAIFRHFRSFTLSVISDLDVPQDTRDALWADSMALIAVTK